MARVVVLKAARKGRIAAVWVNVVRSMVNVIEGVVMVVKQEKNVGRGKQGELWG